MSPIPFISPVVSHPGSLAPLSVWTFSFVSLHLSPVVSKLDPWRLSLLSPFICLPLCPILDPWRLSLCGRFHLSPFICLPWRLSVWTFSFVSLHLSPVVSLDPWRLSLCGRFHLSPFICLPFRCLPAWVPGASLCCLPSFVSRCLPAWIRSLAPLSVWTFSFVSLHLSPVSPNWIPGASLCVDVFICLPSFVPRCQPGSLAPLSVWTFSFVSLHLSPVVSQPGRLGRVHLSRFVSLHFPDAWRGSLGSFVSLSVLRVNTNACPKRAHVWVPGEHNCVLQVNRNVLSRHTHICVQGVRMCVFQEHMLVMCVCVFRVGKYLCVFACAHMCVPRVHVRSNWTRVCVPGTHVCIKRTRVCVRVPGVHTCVCVCLCTHMCVHVYTYVCSRVHICVFHAYIFPCSRVHTCAFQLDMFQENTCLLSDEHVSALHAHVCVFTCAHRCVPRVRICVFKCAHMCVPTGHVLAFQENTRMLSDERVCMCVFRSAPRAHVCVCVHLCTFLCSTCAHLCVHVCTHVCFR